MLVFNLSLLLTVAAGFASAAVSPALNIAQARATTTVSVAHHYSHSTAKPHHQKHKHHHHHHHDKSKSTARPKRRPSFPRHKTMTTSKRVTAKPTTKQPAPERTTTLAQTTTKAPLAAPTTTTTTKKTLTTTTVAKPTTVKPTTKTTTAAMTTTTTTSDPQPTGGLSTLAVDSLKAHNDFRALHNAKPLEWDSSLQASAQAWADKCVFEHGGGVALGAGENLAATTDTKASAASLIKMWTDEAKDYDPAHPMYSHFTQVVWKATSRLGCAQTVCNPLQSAGFNGLYYVCHYLQAGNIMSAGQFAANVE